MRKNDQIIRKKKNSIQRVTNKIIIFIILIHTQNGECLFRISKYISRRHI